MGTYYDLDAIMTDAQKVPTTFELDVKGLGFMEGNDGGDLKAGTKIEAPLWLAEILAVSQSLGAGAMATIDMPAALSPRVINALKADPKAVDVRAQAAHFYSLGARMLELFEDPDVVDVLTETLKQRAAKIADHAHNARGALGEGVDFMRGLDETERALFRVAHDGAGGVKSFLAGERKG